MTIRRERVSLWSRFFRRRRYSTYISSREASQYRYATYTPHTHRCRKKKNNDHVWSRLWNNFRSLFSETFLSAVRIPRRPPPRLYIMRSAHVYIYIIICEIYVYYIVILRHKVISNNFHYFGIVYLYLLQAYSNIKRWESARLWKTAAHVPNFINMHSTYIVYYY